jgi:hypothetical protein
MTFTVAHKDQRCLSVKEALNYGYCKTAIKIFRVEGDERKLVAEKFKFPHRDLHVEVRHLEAGKYAIFVQVIWGKQAPAEFTVVGYGVSPIKYGDELRDSITFEDLGFPSYND